MTIEKSMQDCVLTKIFKTCKRGYDPPLVQDFSLIYYIKIPIINYARMNCFSNYYYLQKHFPIWLYVIRLYLLSFASLYTNPSWSCLVLHTGYCCSLKERWCFIIIWVFGFQDLKPLSREISLFPFLLFLFFKSQIILLTYIYI